MNTEKTGDATTIPTATRSGVRDLHVKAIPEAVWVRARCNATCSGLSFKDYLIRVLGSCQPLAAAQPTTPVG